MENKKNEQVNLAKKNKLFFGLGLIISISLVLVAFEMNFTYQLSADALALKKEEVNESVMIEPPRTEEMKPQLHQPIQAPAIKEVPDKQKVKTFIEETTEDKPTDQVKVITPSDETTLKIIPKKEEKEDIQLIYNAHELQEQAEFIGGQKEFYKFLSKNIIYPKMARRVNTQGTVYLEFVIEKDGTLSDIKIKKPIVNGNGCNEEAMRVLKASPKWKPAKQRGVYVRQRMIIPVKFTIE